MARKRRAFTVDYKSEAVRRLGERRQQGISLTQIGRELGIRPDVLRRWEKEYGGRSVTELRAAAELDAEVKRLRRENEVLRQEASFAKKAAAYFAKELR